MGQGTTLTMTMKQVRGMFAVGDEWTADNTYSPAPPARPDRGLLQKKPRISDISRHYDGNAETKVSSRREVHNNTA